MDICEAMIEMIANADRAGANRVMDEWGAKHENENLLVDVLGPVLKIVGEKWQEKEEFSLAQAYVASKITEDALEKYSGAGADQVPGSEAKGPVVLGNIEDDVHALGRRIVATFLRADGWVVHDLGIDVEPKTFVDEAIKVGAKVIGISAMIYTTAEHIQQVRSEIDNRDLTGRVQLAVGGVVFRLRPELVEQFGGDGTAENALGAPALFDRLWDTAVKEGGK